MKSEKWIISLVAGIFLLGFCLTQSASAQNFYFSKLDYSWPVEYQKTETGARIAYIDEGTGTPAIILIHGLGSYIPAWKQNIPILSQSHRVIALDLPGYGKSSKKAEDYSITFFAKAIAQLQDSLEIEKAVWVGHSMGGQIAMMGALTFPEKVSKLVLIAPAGFEQFNKREAAMMNNFISSATVMATPDSVIRQTFKLTFYTFPHEAKFMIEDRINMRKANNFELYARAYDQSVQAMLKEPVFERLDEIDQSALIIFGKQDALIPNKLLHPNLTVKEVAEKGVSEIKNSRILMVDKAGHFVQFEQAEEVNQAILNFIEDYK